MVTIEHIQDGRNRLRVVINGKTLGWIYKGNEVFTARPIGLSQPHTCKSIASADAYILGYHSEAITIKDN
jgi:hypothetical protein